jgi:hypothetical protein
LLLNVQPTQKRKSGKNTKIVMAGF